MHEGGGNYCLLHSSFNELGKFQRTVLALTVKLDLKVITDTVTAMQLPTILAINFKTFENHRNYIINRTKVTNVLIRCVKKHPGSKEKKVYGRKENTVTHDTDNQEMFL